MTDTHSARYRRDIDGLRALAVLVVVIFHAAPSLLPGGFVGVDVFFVISGYLITGLIALEMRERRFSIVDFYGRRFRRIVPALAVVLLTTWALGWVILFPPEFANLGRHVAAGASFTSNLLLWSETGYFDQLAQSKPLLHLWSLGIEEQYYLIWPLILLGLHRWRRLLLPALLLFAASFACNVGVSLHNPDAAFYLLPTRLWELLAGGLLAIVEGQRSQSSPPVWQRNDWLRESLSVCGLLILLVSIAMPLAKDSYPTIGVAVPVLGAVLLIASGPGAVVNRWLFSNRLAVFFGLISYPLYLWHWPLLVYRDYLFIGAGARQSQIATIVAVLLAIMLAWATWRLIEQPLQRRATPLTPQLARRVIGLALAALLVVTALGLGISWRAGFPGRYPPAVLAQLADADLFRAAWAARQRSYPGCDGAFAGLKGTTGCRKALVAPPTLAVWGDSHADHFFSGLSEATVADGESPLFIGHHGCAPLAGVEIDDAGHPLGCAPANARALELLAASSTIRTVILTSRGPLYVSGVDFGAVASITRQLRTVTGYVDDPTPAAGGNTPQGRIFRNGLNGAVGTLEAAGKEVIYVIDVPELGFSPAACLPRLSFAPHNLDCSVPRAEVDARQAEYRALVAEVAAAHPRLRVFDTAPSLCDALRCWGAKDQRILYNDSNHLSLVGSDRVAADFVRWRSANPLATR